MAIITKINLDGEEYNVLNRYTVPFYKDVFEACDYGMYINEEDEYLECHGDCILFRYVPDGKGEIEIYARIDYLMFNDEAEASVDTLYQADDISTLYSDGVRVAMELYDSEPYVNDVVVVVVGYYVAENLPVVTALGGMLSSLLLDADAAVAINLTPYLSYHLEYSLTNNDESYFPARKKVFDKAYEGLLKLGFCDECNDAAIYQHSRYLSNRSLPDEMRRFEKNNKIIIFPKRDSF